MVGMLSSGMQNNYSEMTTMGEMITSLEEATSPPIETTIPETTAPETTGPDLTEPAAEIPETSELVPLETIPEETFEFLASEPVETVEVVIIEEIRTASSNIVHTNLFGSFLVCGTLMGIALCWRFTR